MAEILYPKVYLYRRIVKAKLFIDEHFAEPIDLDAISDEAFFSKFHFIRLFKKTYGKTPHQYLTFVRVEKSKLLLKDGMPVTETCFDIGFDSVSSFTALFKRLAGQTPSAYRETHLKKKEELKTIPLKYVPNCFIEKKGWAQKSNFEEV